MISEMIPFAEHDYIRSYEQAIKQLAKNPENKKLQHQAVLSLAQGGALDFALAEYERYGLDQVQNDEDIMALAGRLSKDLFLKSAGEDAATYAKNSADKYALAFQGTNGYYSGINAATMALMADMPYETVAARANSIIDILPPHDKLSPTDHYFIEATRAESLLLRNDVKQAKLHLKAALAFDPLNYTAHASTLKQFDMILTYQKANKAWLSEFMPPRPMHYAGHINIGTSTSEYEALLSSIVDHIQKFDIGLGFGALAAGSDIIVAEALLGEGAELHVILPCGKDSFIEHSVRPFGNDWVSRHLACLDRAKTVTVMSNDAPWPDSQVNRLAGQFAMGQAVLRGQHLGVSATQLLIWNEKKQASHTALHAADWKTANREQIIIPIACNESNSKVFGKIPELCSFILKQSNGDNVNQYQSIDDIIKAALDMRAASPNVQIALHVNIPNEPPDIILDKILEGGTPKSILMSEAFASLLAHFENRFDISFAGLIDFEHGNDLRCYALNA